MFFLLLIFLLSVFPAALSAAEPVLLVPAPADGGWINPVYSPSGHKIAFSDASQGKIFLWEAGQKEVATVATGPLIGRRFVFEPGIERIVFRRRVEALPQKPERLISLSLYMHDPVVRTLNDEPRIFGPYFVRNTVWYRKSLVEPLLNYADSSRLATPYLDSTSGQLWICNDFGQTVFTSKAGEQFAGAEISPDGEWIAAVQTAPVAKLMIIRLDTGEEYSRIDDGVLPSWSGDSKSVVYIRLTSAGTRHLHYMRIDYDFNRMLAESPGYAVDMPAVNADGTRVAFVSNGALWEVELTLPPAHPDDD